MAESDTSTPTEAVDEGFDNLSLDDDNTTGEDWRMIKKDNDIYRHFHVGTNLFHDFPKGSRPDNEFCIHSILTCFQPGSIDPERLFPYGRLTKNHLQCRLLPENHHRNVFWNKNMCVFGSEFLWLHRR